MYRRNKRRDIPNSVARRDETPHHMQHKNTINQHSLTQTYRQIPCSTIHYSSNPVFSQGFRTVQVGSGRVGSQFQCQNRCWTGSKIFNVGLCVLNVFHGVQRPGRVGSEVKKSNLIPIEIKSLNPYQTFKRRLQAHLLSLTLSQSHSDCRRLRFSSADFVTVCSIDYC